ncbi:MAG: hypothetical protein U0893_01830 [Chloroflexota bacterium]
MPASDVPHRIVVERIVYRLEPTVIMPPDVEKLGQDAEGRTVYVDRGRAASRKYVYLPAAEPSLAAYVRDDPPPGYGLVDLLADAFLERLPRPEALGLLGLLRTNHVVLADGTRLGGPLPLLAEAVTTVALEPGGFAEQVRRVPEWALTEALRPRLEQLRAHLLSVPFVRALSSPELGYVRAIARAELVVARTSAESLDVGSTLVVRTSAGHGPLVLVRVVDLTEKDARVVQVDAGRDDGVSHGDPVELVVTERGLASD